MIRLNVRASLSLALAFWVGLAPAYVPAAPSPAVLVAVLDSPIDDTHPELAPAIAKDILLANRFVDDDGVEKSWWDFNQKEKKRLENAIDWRYFDAEIDFLEERRSESGIPNHDETLANVLTYIHGTHVAGIAIRNGGVRLVHFPLNTLDEPFDLAKLLAFEPAKLKEATHRRVRAVSEALKRQRIRVVNMSLSSSNRNALQHAQRGATEEQKLEYAESFRRVAEADAKILRDELAWLYAQNPDTVFVVSAGNQSLDLANFPDHTSSLQAPNVLKVAALDGEGRLAGFSNYSAGFVQIAASGVNISSTKAGSGHLRLSGTSQAAPQVTRTLAKIFAAKADASAAEAITELYEKYVDRNPELADAIAEGRVLRPDAGP